MIGLQRSPVQAFGTISNPADSRLILLFGLLGLYLVRGFLLWPLSAFSVFIGYVSGIPDGIPLVLVGTVFTCFPPFLIGKRLGRETEYFASVAAAEEVFTATGELRGMIAARVSPMPADIVSYGAGMAGVTSRTFIAGTLVGELPWAIGYVFLGDSLHSFSTAAANHISMQYISAAMIVAILLVARPLIRYLSARQSEVS